MELRDKTMDMQGVFRQADTPFVEHMLSVDDQAAVHVLAELICAKGPPPDPNT
jgi:hypothetical protein